MQAGDLPISRETSSLRDRALGLLRRSKLAAGVIQMNWSVADQVVVSGGNLLTGVLVARFLGIEQFGVFSLLWLVLLLLQGTQSATILAPMVTIGPKEQRADAREFYYGIM